MSEEIGKTGGRAGGVNSEKGEIKFVKMEELKTKEIPEV
jgi:hypothetical protein